MKTTLLISLLTLLVYTSYGQSTLFQQDFSAGGVPANYVDAANPGTTKFTDIGVTPGTNATPTVAIVNGAVELARLNADNGGGQSRLVRGIDLSASVTSLYIQFTVDVSVGNSALWSAGTGIAFMNIGTGSGFSNGGTIPPNAETFGKLFFTSGGTKSSVTWTLAKRVGGTTTNSTTFFQGKHLITWIVNNTGYRVTYVKPNGVGGTETIDTNKWDVWIDGTEIFDEVPATTTGIDLRKFKFIFDGGIGIIYLDDFLIRDVSGALPVSLTHFSGKARGMHVDLSWQTVSEQNSDRFSIERSTDAREFAEIGSVAAAGNADGQRTYGYTDLHPLPGLTYYRLRQLDRNGTASLSRTVAVDRTVTVPDFTVLDNPGTGTSIAVRPENLAGATYQLTTLAGQLLTCQQRETPEGTVTLLPQHTLPSGVYLLTASTEIGRITRRVLVR